MDWYIQWFGNPYNWEPYYDYGYDMWYDNYVTPQMEQPQYYQDTAPALGNVAPQQYLNNYADMYSQSNPAISQQYRNLANQAGMRWDTQRNILNWYDGLANDVANRQQYVTNISGNLANDLLWDINNQRDYIYSLYWPNGSITQEVNDYYSGLSNAISWDTGRQLAQSDVNAKTAGVSVWANRNTQNQIYNEGYERALKAKEADINAKNNIVSSLQNYMSALRQEYGDTTDKYIIQKYQQANDLLNQIQSSMTQDMVNLENSKLQFNMQRALQSIVNKQQPNTSKLTEEQKKELEEFNQAYNRIMDATMNWVPGEVINNSDEMRTYTSFLDKYPEAAAATRMYPDNFTWYVKGGDTYTNYFQPLGNIYNNPDYKWDRYIPTTSWQYLTFNDMRNNNNWFYQWNPNNNVYDLTWLKV